MKAEVDNDVGTDNDANDAPLPIVGDVIGDTAYSERFVLKILLKLANQNTLKEEIKEQDFEQELCTLWDMAAERDVVLYLQTHDVLKLFTFALPVIDNNRIIEIIIGTIANMCCHNEAVNSLMANRDMVKLLLEFLKCDTSEILIQLLRLVSSCLYVADDDNIAMWLGLFRELDYADTLYFILRYSSNKELLMAALENLNTICINCQLDTCLEEFYGMFETEDTPFALYTAHNEYSKLAAPDETLERLHIITLQMMLHLTKVVLAYEPPGVEIQNIEVSEKSKYDYVIYLLQDILVGYETKIEQYHIMIENYVDVVAVLDAAGAVISYFELSKKCVPGYYFTPCYHMWQVLSSCERQENNVDFKTFKSGIQVHLASIMATYMAHCTDENLLNSLDDLGDDYEAIANCASHDVRDTLRVRVGVHLNHI